MKGKITFADFFQNKKMSSPNIPQRSTVTILQILTMHQYICIGAKPIKNIIQIIITPIHHVLTFELFLSRNLHYSVELMLQHLGIMLRYLQGYLLTDAV